MGYFFKNNFASKFCENCHGVVDVLKHSFSLKYDLHLWVEHYKFIMADNGFVSFNFRSMCTD